MHQMKATLRWIRCLAVFALASLNLCSEAQLCSVSYGSTVVPGLVLLVESSEISTTSLASLSSRSLLYNLTSTIRGMHYDYHRQRIYVTTSQMEIRQLNVSISTGVNLEVAVQQDSLVFQRDRKLTNIVVDWINDELYWVEENGQGGCQVMRADVGRNVSCSFMAPTCNISLSIDAFHGYLYWSTNDGVVRVSLETAQNSSTPCSALNGNYVVQSLSQQPAFTVDLVANLLYYANQNVVYSALINTTSSNQTYKCVNDFQIPVVLVASYGQYVVIYSAGPSVPSMYIVAGNRVAHTSYLYTVMQYFHPDLQPLPCPPSPPLLIHVQSTSSVAIISWSAPQPPPTISDSCATGSVFSKWVYTVSYSLVGGPPLSPINTTELSLAVSGLQSNSVYQFTLDVTGLSPVIQRSSVYVFTTSKIGTSRIILATSTQLLSSDTSGGSSTSIGPQASTSQSNAIAYDSYSGDFFWTTTAQTNIFQLANGLSSYPYTNVQAPSNLKYDWISKQLYWIQKSTMNSNLKSIVAGDRGVLKDQLSFTALAVDPYQGVIFWTIEGNGAITMRSINGLWPEKACITNINPPPQALTVNPVDRMLYWVSAPTGASPIVGSIQYSLNNCNSSFVNITLTDISSPPPYVPSCLQAPILGYALGKLYLAFCDKETVYSFASNFQSITNQRLAMQNITFSGQSIRDITFTSTELQPLPDNMDPSQRGSIIPSKPGLPTASYVSINTVTLTWSPSTLSFTTPIWYVLTYSQSQQSGAVPSPLTVSVNSVTISGLTPNGTYTASVVAYSLWGVSQPSGNATFKLIYVPSPVQNVRAYVYNPLQQRSNFSALVVWDPSQEVVSNYTVQVFRSGTLIVQIVVPGDYSQTPVFARSSRNELQYVLVANTMYSVTVVASNVAGTSNQSIPVNFTTNAPSSNNMVLAVGTSTISTDVAISISLPLPLTVNTIGREVYWYSQSSLMRMNLNGKNQLLLVSTKASQMLGNVTAMAYDWVGERVYLIDSNGGQLTLWRVPIINPDSLERVTSLGTGLLVTSLIVDPFSGYAYWSNGLLNGLQKLNLRTLNRTNLAISPLALAFDPINGVLWISNGTGDILTYSNDTTKVVVNATAVTMRAGMTLSQLGLPAMSLTLDEYKVYWTSPNANGIFYVFRNNTGAVFTLTTYSGVVSAIFSTSPGMQPLPPVECLSYDASSAAQLLKPNQTSSSSNSVLIAWTAPQPLASCQTSVLNFPALKYHIQLNNGVSYTSPFNTQYLITQLTSYSMYRVTVYAFNQYTIAFNSSYYDSTYGVVLSPQPSSYTTIMTTEGVPNGPQITNTYSNGTRTIFVQWNTASIADLMGNINNLLYYILIGTQSWSTVNTNYTLTGLEPGLHSIKVITSNGVFNSTPSVANQSTWPRPPTPEIVNTTNMSITFNVNLTSILNYVVHYNVQVIISATSSPVFTSSLQSASYKSLQNVTVSGLEVFTSYTITVEGFYISNDREQSLPRNAMTLSGVPAAPKISRSGDYLIWTPFRFNTDKGNIKYRLLISSTTPGVAPLNVQLESTRVVLENSQYRYEDPIANFLLRASAGTYTLTLFASNEIGEGNGSQPLQYNYDAALPVSLELIIGTASAVGGFVLFTVVIFTIVICCVVVRQRSKRGKMSIDEDQELSNLRKNLKAYSSNPQYAWSGDDFICDDEQLDLLHKFPRSYLKLEDFIDRGEFGEVFQGTATDILGPGTGPIPVAVKTLRKGAGGEEQKKFLAEAALMSNFSHPNIVKVLGVCLENDPVYIIMELMPGGDLLHFLREAKLDHGPPLLTVRELIQIALDIAQGCCYLQKAHFIHRDLAARNCLVSSKGADRVVKIGDFGLAKDLYSSDCYQVEGQRKLPVRWMAPEALLQGKFNMESDVWSFGVLLWEIMTFGNQPYPALNNQEVLRFVTADGRLEKPENCSVKIYHLMQICWRKIASERPHFESIIEILNNYLEHLRRESVSSDEDSDEGVGVFERQESKKSKNSSIRSGILSLARQGSMKLRNSLRRHGSVHRKEDQGTNNQLSVSSSENLVDRENNTSSQAVERGPF